MYIYTALKKESESMQLSASPKWDMNYLSADLGKTDFFVCLFICLIIARINVGVHF